MPQSVTRRSSPGGAHLGLRGAGSTVKWLEWSGVGDAEGGPRTTPDLGRGNCKQGAEFGILGALNALNPLYHLAKSAVDTFMAADRGDWEAVGQGGVKTGVAAVGVVGAVAGAAAGSVAARGTAARITSGSQVTEKVIREAMKDAKLTSQQVRGVSLPRVQQYVDKLIAGETAPAIKVDGHMIVDGNHRYIAGKIVDREPAIQQWAGGRPASAVLWEKLPINPEAW